MKAALIERLTQLVAVRGLTWLDVLDILIVAFLIYQLLQFVRSTHAVQIAFGGGALVLLYWISELLDLQAVNWLLRTFLPYAIFGAIVVFQAEIRKMLAHIGKTPLFEAFSASAESRTCRNCGALHPGRAAA